MKVSYLTLLSGAALFAIGLTGCTTDDAYNQLTEKDGIDLTINIAPNGLTVPLGSIDRVWLTEIMDTTTTDVLKINPETNLFYIEETGSLDTTSINVDKVKFGYKPKISSAEFALDIEYAWSPIEQMAIDRLSPDTPLDELFADSHTVLATRDHMDLGKEEADALNFSFHHEGTDPAIVSISEVEFENISSINLVLNISKLPGEMQEYDFTIDSVRLLAPAYINVVDAEGKPLERDAETGELVLPTSSVHKAKNSTTVQWHMASANLNGISFGEDKLINNNGVIERDGDIHLGGRILIDGLSVEAKDLKVVGPKNGSTHNTVELKEKIKIDPVVNVDSISVKSITGVFDPQIEDMSVKTVLDLDSKLDFLTDARTSFDPKELSVGIDLAYNCPLATTAWIEVANNQQKKTRVEGIKVYEPENEEQLHIMLTTNDPEGKPDTYQLFNIADVFSPIPEEIFLNVGIASDKQETKVNLGKNYKIYARYNVYFPLTFNEVNSTYEEIVEDVFKDIDAIDGINEVVFEMKVKSTLGIDTKVNIVGHNQAGVEDPSVLSCIQNGYIARGTIDNPAESDIKIELSVKDIQAVKDLAIQFNIMGQDCDLRPNQYLEVNDMRLTFKNQNINLNDKD